MLFNSIARKLRAQVCLPVRNSFTAANKPKERSKVEADLPDASVLAQLSLDNVKVEKLVREFLSAQSLTILPQNSFGDAVSQFVDKDDRHAMEVFVNESLSNQVKHLLTAEDEDDEHLEAAMDQYRTKLEELFAAGHLKTARKRLKPKPDNWDSDLDGSWADDPSALIRSDEDDDENDDSNSVAASAPAKPAATRGRGRGGKAAAASTRKTAAAAKKAPAARGKAKKPIAVISEDEEEEDVIMIDDDDEEEDEETLFVQPKPAPKKPASRAAPKRTASPPTRRAPSRTTASKQTTLNFSQSSSATQARAASGRSRKAREPVSVTIVFPSEYY